MNKKILIILAIISALIIVFGVISGLRIMNNSKNSTVKNIYLDETDVTPFVNAFTSLGSSMIAFWVISNTFLVVAGIWVIYGIIFLIVKIIDKFKNKRNK